MPDISSKSRSASIVDLITRKKYSKAIELIRDELKRRRNDPHLRLQLADVLALSGKREQAAALLSELADDFALSGAAAKAIALLKKVQSFDRSRADVEERLAYLISQQKRPAPDPWERSRASVSVIRPEPAAAQPASFPGDMEEIPQEAGVEIGAASPPAAEQTSEKSASAAQKTDATPPLASMPAPAAIGSFDLDLGDASSQATASEATSDDSSEPPVSIDQLKDELMVLIEDVFTGQAPLETSALSSLPVVETPLFRDFSCEELVEVIRGLKLRVFEPGAIIITEDEPGASLFVLTSGVVRAHVRNSKGSNIEVRCLQDGDFFGEISLLKGGCRTATITAASHCELLEIEREVFGGISQKHPRIWTVLKQFYDQRAGSTLEAAARAKLGPEDAA